jgi:chromosome segregation ATPase
MRKGDSRDPQASEKSILVEPHELVIENATSGKLYIEEFELTNSLGAAVEVSLRVSNKPDRTYEIFPKTLRLEPSASHRVEIRIKLTKPLKKSVKEFVSIKSDYFDQKFFVSIHPPKATSIEEHARPIQRAQISTKERSNYQTKIDDLETEKEIIHQRLVEREKDVSTLNQRLSRLEEENDEIAIELSKAEE